MHFNDVLNILAAAYLELLPVGTGAFEYTIHIHRLREKVEMSAIYIQE